MTQPFRSATSGRIDRSRRIPFTFDGRPYWGHPGDTLASALLANGVTLLGRSFKYHRPRGLLTAGAEEPNALVTLGKAGKSEANTRATMVELYEDLEAYSQNAWPSLAFDLGAINGVFSRLIPSGFYYKTFLLGSSRLWTRLYEPFIRRAAGLGPAPTVEDPDFYDKRHAHCDVLVIGAGPAGLAAARSASAGGARVIVIDERAAPGGSLLASSDQIDNLPAADWAAQETNAFVIRQDTRLLRRTTAIGLYDHNLVMAAERLTDHEPVRAGPRQRLWQIRAGHVILATGAHEQPLQFGNNDLPGIMLASAGMMFARQYGALPGRRVIIATANDYGHEVARGMIEAGAEIAAVVDSRSCAPASAEFPVIAGGTILQARGRKRVSAVDIAAKGRTNTIACDAVLMGGCWQPALHLHSHSGGRSRYDEEAGCFVPANSLPNVTSVGGCKGDFTLSACLEAGHAAGNLAAANAGYPSSTDCPKANTPEIGNTAQNVEFAETSSLPKKGKAFVDYQNDVTTADIDLAVREGFVSVEHLKRYTTTGMATDQGKLSNITAIRQMAGLMDCTPGQVGTTTFRPPYTPVTFGTLAGIDRGDLMDPVRMTPMHDWHDAHGAQFENVGQWKRAWFYPRPGETMDQAVRRECQAVRTAVGMLDASTLGKIDVAGIDAATFLDRVYTNAWGKLPIGQCRYGIMCGEDGMVMDDGVTARIGEHRYLMTTTTGNAAKVMDHLEDLLQTEWPDLRVRLTSVTEHWAVTTVTGPQARKVLEKVIDGTDLSKEAFPALAFRTATIGDVQVRIFRVSFTGELSYEVHAPAQHALSVWEAVHRAGAPFGITAYGTEALHVLRAEKGFIIIGQETDGTATPMDLGLGWAIARSKPDFIGKRSLERPDCLRQDRRQLVGLEPLDGKTHLTEGAQLTSERSPALPARMVGHITSAYWSGVRGAPIALAMLEGGRTRHGETVYAHATGRVTECRVRAPVYYDTEGERMHG